jgi:hypothetical protein
MDTIVYTFVNSCGTAATAMVVTVNALPVPVITSLGTTLSAGTGYLSYKWFVNGTLIAAETAATITPTADGIYTAEVTDGNGCTGLSAGYTVALGVNNIAPAAVDIKIYPNPSESVVYIKSPVRVNVSVFAVDGRLAISQQDVTSIDMGSLASGAYMIVVYDNETGVKLKTERIMKMGE